MQRRGCCTFDMNCRREIRFANRVTLLNT
jgi:hypothetical protein